MPSKPFFDISSKRALICEGVPLSHVIVRAPGNSLLRAIHVSWLPCTKMTCLLTPYSSIIASNWSCVTPLTSR